MFVSRTNGAFEDSPRKIHTGIVHFEGGLQSNLSLTCLYTVYVWFEGLILEVIKKHLFIIVTHKNISKYSSGSKLVVINENTLVNTVPNMFC